MKLTRTYDPVEIRVLGALLEKQQTTPEYYPMTLNSLIAACNQKSNRFPVTEYSEEQISAALDKLQHQVLVWKVMGARTAHWKHNLDGPLELDGPSKAILTMLLLRGPQTTGELRGRTERLHNFPTIEEIEQVLLRMAADSDPLIVEVPRQTGRKESRWMHLLEGPVLMEAARSASSPPASTRTDSLQRIEQLENRLSKVEEVLRELKEKLGE